MVTPDVTVVVISFNDAARLPRAIRSIQRQTLSNLEIVVVDDASTDGTEQAVLELAKADPRLRYERLPVNSGGCSAPRNRGVEIARAPWVMFCDSDDEYERHACKNLLEAAERLDADVVCGTAERVDVRTGRTKRWRPDVHEVERAEDGLVAFPELLYDTISVNKIYRRSLLVDNGIRFPEGLLFEDQIFTLEAFASAARVAAIPQTVYRWYVDRLSDEPSITQRRHEASNVESRVEINRRIDAFLAERGLADVKRIKDLKFLRHDLYLYLSSMLDVDDETAQLLIDRLRPYVSTVNLEPAWEIRSALRVAIFHLLVDDLEGIRSAMRFVRWASVVEMPIVEESGRDFWGCDHLGAHAAVGGFDTAQWLDVTDLHIPMVPFTQRRYLHRLTAITVAGGTVTATGTTVDFDGSLADVSRLELRFIFNAERAVASLPAVWTQKTDRVWHWTATGTLTAQLGRRLRLKDQGTVSIAMTADSLENTSNCRAAESDTPRVRVPYPGRVEMLGPDALELYAYGNGSVGWRAVRVSARRVWLAGLQRSWFTVPGARRLAIITGLIRRDVILAVLQKLGALLPARRLAVFESDGGRSVADATAAISARLLVADPGLRQAWVHRGRPELVPHYAEAVEHMSTRHHWLMARARLWVDDGTSPLTIRKPAHTEAVVVADGVPMHRIGLDDPSVLVSRASLRDVKTRSQRTDTLVTASPYASERLTTALGFRGKSAEAGLARVDTALGMRIEQSLASLRELADLPVDRAVVLYAPAFRRRESDAFDPLLDLERWSEVLGTRAFLLLRPPRQQRFAVSTRLRYAIRSIPDDADLAPFLAMTDLVITDYATTAGDAALLDIPTILFQPDREMYVNRTRGLYEHPGSAGPIATTMSGVLGEVESWLADPGAWDARHGLSRRLLAEQCGPADGRSAERAAAAIVDFIAPGRP